MAESLDSWLIIWRSVLVMTREHILIVAATGLVVLVGVPRRIRPWIREYHAGSAGRAPFDRHTFVTPFSPI